MNSGNRKPIERRKAIMFTTKFSKLCCLLITSAVALFLIPLQSGASSQPFQVTAVSLTASPAKYEGPCPGVIKFSGTITVNGRGTVKYTFLRSDGATAPVFTLAFAGPGTKTVGTTWTLGGAALPNYSGWEAIKILSPNEMVSDKAGFELICREKPNFMVTDASLKANPPRFEGPCPAVIKFLGTITTNAGGVVKYTFLRSDGATGPVFSLAFAGAGTKSVSTTWTLGGKATPKYSGWEAIKIVSPNVMESNKASFEVICTSFLR
jgi:hypothetical protein